MTEVTHRQRLDAVNHYVLRTSCDLYNIVPDASHRYDKQKGRDIHAVKSVIKVLPSLICNRNNCLGIYDIHDRFFGEAAVTLCHRTASSWHDWVVMVAGDVVLAILDDILPHVHYDLLQDDTIAIADNVPAPDPTNISWQQLHKTILYSGPFDFPLVRANLNALDAHLEVEYINAIKRLKTQPAIETTKAEQKKAPQSNGQWSKPDTPSRWAKRFGFSVDTFKRRVNDEKIRAKKLSDKSYQVHVDDLPEQ